MINWNNSSQRGDTKGRLNRFWPRKRRVLRELWKLGNLITMLRLWGRKRRWRRKKWNCIKSRRLLLKKNSLKGPSEWARWELLGKIRFTKRNQFVSKLQRYLQALNKRQFKLKRIWPLSRGKNHWRRCNESILWFLRRLLTPIKSLPLMKMKSMTKQ